MEKMIMDKQWTGAAEAQRRVLPGSERPQSLNPSQVAIERETEFTTLRERLNVLSNRFWRANEEMTATANRISGAQPEAGKAEVPHPMRPGILGEIDKILESMSEAASALEDRAAYFHRLG